MGRNWLHSFTRSFVFYPLKLARCLGPSHHGLMEHRNRIGSGNSKGPQQKAPRSTTTTPAQVVWRERDERRADAACLKSRPVRPPKRTRDPGGDRCAARSTRAGRCAGCWRPQRTHPGAGMLADGLRKLGSHGARCGHRNPVGYARFAPPAVTPAIAVTPRNNPCVTCVTCVTRRMYVCMGDGKRGPKFH